MDIIIDASAILSVLLNEPLRENILAKLKGCNLLAPASLEFEIGNALSALLKRGSLSIADACSVYHAFTKVSIRLVQTDIASALIISGEDSIYAYDAYFISCAERLGYALLTLDKHLAATALKRGITLVEV